MTTDWMNTFCMWSPLAIAPGRETKLGWSWTAWLPFIVQKWSRCSASGQVNAIQASSAAAATPSHQRDGWALRPRTATAATPPAGASVPARGAAVVLNAGPGR